MKKVKREPYYCEQRQSWVVPLTRGLECLVDEESLDMIGRRNWCADPSGSRFYACTTGGQRLIRMHRMLTGCPDGMEVDHINGDGLDNRMSNLRVCTKRENQQNRTSHRNGRKAGSSFDISRRAWKSYIRIDKKLKHLGYFKTEFEAHERYIEEYKKISGL